MTKFKLTTAELRRKCSYAKRQMNRKISINEVKKRFQLRGLKLLSTIYKNDATNLDYECLKCGYRGKKTLNAVKRSGCYKCNIKIKSDNNTLSQKDVCGCFAKKDLLLVGKYISAKSPVEYQCKRCGYEDKIAYDVVLRAKYGCNRCAINGTANALKLTIEEVKASFARYNLIPYLEKYENTSQKISYKCLTCGYEGVTTVRHIRSRGGCKMCGFERSSQKQRLDIAKIQQIFQELSLIWISGDYKNNRSNLQYRCLRCSHTGAISLVSLNNCVFGCHQCAKTNETENSSRTKLKNFFINSNKNKISDSTTLSKAQSIVKSLKEDLEKS